MIDLNKLDVGDKVRITFFDDEELNGIIVSIDDEEESGLGEDGISIDTDDGSFVGIGQSEIKSVEHLAV